MYYTLFANERLLNLVLVHLMHLEDLLYAGFVPNWFGIILVPEALNVDWLGGLVLRLLDNLIASCKIDLIVDALVFKHFYKKDGEGYLSEKRGPSLTSAQMV